MRRLAFTLIELLVVIAIIAILAAILFPVFAQAKAAAKKTAGLSNQKQIGTSLQMYLNDFDDTVPIDHYNQPGSAFPADKVYWPLAMQPYIKSWPLFRDPSESQSFVWGGAANVQWYYNFMRWPHYGYNWSYLNLDPTCGVFGTNPAAGKNYLNGPPVSATSFAQPAATVIFTDAKVAGTASGGWYTSESVESPAGYTAPGMCTWSNGGWGTNAYGDEVGLYASNPTSTGIVAPRETGGMNVVLGDSHAKYYTPGALAAGTDWKVGKTNDQINITDESIYIWDLK